MSRKKPSRRPEDDVEIVGHSSVHGGGRNKPLTKSSRAQELRIETVHLRYQPTGEEGRVEIPPGHYTKRELQRLREATKTEFLRQIGKIPERT